MLFIFLRVLDVGNLRREKACLCPTQVSLHSTPLECIDRYLPDLQTYHAAGVKSCVAVGMSQPIAYAPKTEPIIELTF